MNDQIAATGSLEELDRKIVCTSLRIVSADDASVGVCAGEDGDASVDPDQVSLATMQDLINEAKWSEVAQFIEEDHERASLQNRRGRTCLHLLCSASDSQGYLPSLSCIDSVLQACVAAAWTPDDFGWTPLNLACGNNAPLELVSHLIRVHPAPISMQTHCGMTPIYLATWCRAPIEVVKTLLEVGPTLVLWPTIVEETPLTILWNQMVEHRLTDDEEAWERMELFLMAAYHHSIVFDSSTGLMSDGVKFRPLHAACAIGACPTSLVKAIIKRHPDQIWERDEEGRLPLMLAIKAPLYEPPKKGQAETVDERKREEPLSLIELLVNDYPSAANIPGPDGRFTLNTALENGKRWHEDGARALCFASPDVLSMPDGATGLYPFMLAALGSTQSLSAIYEMLRTHPVGIYSALQHT